MYRAVFNPETNPRDCRWLVVDMDGKTISEHIDRESAEDAAFEMNERVIRERETAIRLMEARREFIECSKTIGLEKVWSDGMICEIIEICQQARRRITKS